MNTLLLEGNQGLVKRLLAGIKALVSFSKHCLFECVPLNSSSSLSWSVGSSAIHPRPEAWTSEKTLASLNASKISRGIIGSFLP